MFPEELPKRLIKMFSFVGETVLDPFAGSGTTLLAAKNLGRNSVGYEINREFLPIIKEKLCSEQTNVFEEGRVIFQRVEKVLNTLLMIYHTIFMIRTKWIKRWM